MNSKWNNLLIIATKKMVKLNCNTDKIQDYIRFRNGCTGVK